MKRLEKGSGDDLEFWEIKVQRKKNDVRIRSGLATTMGRTVVTEYASHELAVEAMERAIAEKIAEGWAEPVQVRIAADCQKGLSLANPEIDALIAADPSAIEPYLVYGDWLLQRHDPRGELINVQAKLAQHPSSIDFQRMAEDLFRRFKKELLGDVIAELRASSPKSSLRWRYGFLRAARCRPIRGAYVVDPVIRGVLSHPSAKFLEHLVITFGWTGSPQAAFAAVEQLAPTTMKSLAVGDRYSYRLDVEHLWPVLHARPTITTLTLSSRMDTVQIPNHPIQTIKTLRLNQLDRPALESLMRAEWPNVTDLHIHMPHPPQTRSYTPQGQPTPPPPSTPFVTLFPKAFPRVRRITFKVEPYYPDRFGEQVDEIESDLKSTASLLKTTLNLNPPSFPDLLDL
jgi:uncharacterized protein (TIGR02996 family)